MLNIKGGNEFHRCLLIIYLKTVYSALSPHTGQSTNLNLPFSVTI